MKHAHDHFRKLCGWLLAGPLLSAAIFSNSALAQTYPTKAIRFVIPFAPGGGTDLIARALATPLSEALGQPVLADTRAGAGGVLGGDIVAKASPDGYTLLMGTPGTLTINPNLMAKPPYTLNDFAPITQVTSNPFVVLVNPAVPANSIKEVIAYAKANPGKLNFSSPGNGSTGHLAGEQLNALAGIDLVHIPYKGSNQSLLDVVAGQVQMTFENLPVALPQVKAGKVRLLAVGSPKRSSQVPDVPTVAETLPGYESTTAAGVLTTAKAPPAIIAQLNRELVKIIKSAPFQDKLKADGWEIIGGTPEQYATQLRQESALIAKIAKAANITLD